MMMHRTILDRTTSGRATVGRITLAIYDNYLSVSKGL